MGFPFELALRYMRSRKRAFISVGTAFAILGVSLGTAALSTVMSVTGGFRAEFREKVHEIDRLSWQENKVSGSENHHFLLATSDMKGQSWNSSSFFIPVPDAAGSHDACDHAA